MFGRRKPQFKSEVDRAEFHYERRVKEAKKRLASEYGLKKDSIIVLRKPDQTIWLSFLNRETNQDEARITFSYASDGTLEMVPPSLADEAWPKTNRVTANDLISSSPRNKSPRF